MDTHLEEEETSNRRDDGSTGDSYCSQLQQHDEEEVSSSTTHLQPPRRPDDSNLRTESSFDHDHRRRTNSSDSTRGSTDNSASEDETFHYMNPLEKNNIDDENEKRADDITAISLLQQIFPEESIDHLRHLHAARCDSMSHDGKYPSSHHYSINRSAAVPPRIDNDDFLRLPRNIAVRRPMSNMNIIRREVDENRHRHSSFQYVLIDDLERQVAMPLLSSKKKRSSLYTYVIPRQNQGSLGLTLTADLQVIDISNSNTAANSPISSTIQLGDVVWGVEGCVLPRHDVNTAMEMLRSAPDPVVLHLLRDDNDDIHIDDGNGGYGFESYNENLVRTVPSLLDVTNNTHDETETQTSSTSVVSPNLPQHDQHPLVIRLVKQGINIDSPSAIVLLNAIRNTVARNNDDDSSYTTLIPALSVRVVNVFLDPEQERAYTLWVHDVAAGSEWYAPIRYDRDFRDLRSALLSCTTSSKTKQKSWNRIIQSIPFPNSKSLSSSSKNGTWATIIFASHRRTRPQSGNESSTSSSASLYPGDIDAIARQLEYFLRSMCTFLHKKMITISQIPLDESPITEMAVLLQSFLGFHDLQQQQQQQQIRDQIPQYIALKDDQQPITILRTHLQRRIRLYTHRVLLTVDEIRQCLDDFVDVMRTQGPKWHDLEELEAKGKLKYKANQYLQRLQVFLDEWQDVIVDGCQDDFRNIASQAEFAPLKALMETRSAGSGSSTGTDFWDRLVREAVREQVEMEVYVPLRSVVSRWLVRGWRHEDMEVSFKIKELRKRPPDFFVRGGGNNLQNACGLNGQIRPTEWSTVCSILSEGVGLSTLPCVKLRAIVEAAKEIFRIFSTKKQHPTSGGNTAGGYPRCDFASSSSHPLGADDFLPIFIYCVVQAEIERPCALCVLLRSLCDRINKIGEIGYYLLTFEAAITHCQEIDLTEDCEEMQSFLSIPLDDDDENDGGLTT